MACNCCHGDEAVFYKDADNCAFIDSKGEMLVIVDGKEMTFHVERCPRCAHMFTSEKYLNMRQGDDIWYADEEEGFVEHGIVDTVLIKDNKVESFSVNFDGGDWDLYDGGGLGVHYFLDEASAKDALVRPSNEFKDIKQIPVAVKHSRCGLKENQDIWYVDITNDNMKIEHAIVLEVITDRGTLDYVHILFDDGCPDILGASDINTKYFTSMEAAQKAWENEWSEKES